MAPHSIVLFLQLVRQAHEDHRLTYRRTREKNRETLAILGWIPDDMFEHVAGLRPEQALHTPRKSRNPAHTQEMACEFGTRAAGHDIYVKVTVVACEDGAAGCVVSFHIAEKPFQFPSE